MKFEKYLNIDYNQDHPNGKGFVWGWDPDTFWWNTFAVAYFSKNIEFIRDIKLSILFNQMPDYISSILSKIEENPPIITSIYPALNLTYNSSNTPNHITLNNYSVAIQPYKEIVIDPKLDWVIHSITPVGDSVLIRYSQLPKLDWMIPTNEKRSIQLQKNGI
jgi:hypothetical protein